MDGLESVCRQTALIVLGGLFGYFYLERKGGREKAIKLERDHLWVGVGGAQGTEGIKQ